MSPARQEETIEKLRIANAALRRQLKEFSRALEVSLSVASAGKDRILTDPDKAEIEQALIAKEKQLETAMKRIEIYRRANKELRKQIANAYTAERVMELENSAREKEAEIQRLIEENKTLVVVQRNQSKSIARHDAMRDEWPAKLQALQDELRVYKEKIRRNRAAERRAQEQSLRQQEHMARLQERVKDLERQLRQHGAGAAGGGGGGGGGGAAAMGAAGGDVGAGGVSGGGGGVESRERLEREWREEREKLVRQVAVAERSRKQERGKAQRQIKEREDELSEAKRELERHHKRLEEKEREVRMQVMQVKKLKRHLRDIAATAGIDAHSLLAARLPGAEEDGEGRQRGQRSPGVGAGAGSRVAAAGGGAGAGVAEPGQETRAAARGAAAGAADPGAARTAVSERKGSAREAHAADDLYGVDDDFETDGEGDDDV